MPGVTDTVVGYTGGSTEWPTYQSIGDHSEALRITFDPERLSFDEILEAFFEQHAPMPLAFTGTQYRSAVFYHTEAQRLAAERVRAAVRPSVSKHAALIAAGSFYAAEDYHQRFIEKQSAAFGSQARV